MDPHCFLNEKLDPDPHQSKNLGAFETQNGAMDAQNGTIKAQNGGLVGL
jgi:hypothetical protein